MSVSIVAAMVVLVGCAGGEPRPAQTFPTVVSEGSPSAVPDDTPAPTGSPPVPDAALTAPVRPAEMERPDAEGAVAAARYFLSLHLYVLATGDLVEWDQVTWSECQACANIESEVGRVYSSGGHFAPGRIDFSHVEAGPPDPGLGWYPVEVEFTLTAGAEYDANGQEVAAGLQEFGALTVQVVPAPTGWTLIDFTHTTDA